VRGARLARFDAMPTSISFSPYATLFRVRARHDIAQNGIVYDAFAGAMIFVRHYWLHNIYRHYAFAATPIFDFRFTPFAAYYARHFAQRAKPRRAQRYMTHHAAQPVEYATILPYAHFTLLRLRQRVFYARCRQRSLSAFI